MRGLRREWLGKQLHLFRDREREKVYMTFNKDILDSIRNEAYIEIGEWRSDITSFSRTSLTYSESPFFVPTGS